MQGRFNLAGLATLLVVSSAAFAQPATTVQLPTFNIFTVQTAVSVPDGGGAYLGGISRARDGSSLRGFGPLANRGIGMDRGASGMSVHATIIDHKEMDEALLAAAAARRGAASEDATSAKAEVLSSHVGRGIKAEHHFEERPHDATSVAAIRERNAAAASERSGEAAAYFAKAQAAETEGKPAVAKIYYQMVVRRDAGDLKQLAETRLAALASPPAFARR